MFRFNTSVYSTVRTEYELKTQNFVFTAVYSAIYCRKPDVIT